MSDVPLRALVVDYGGVLTTSIGDSFRAFADAHDVDPKTLHDLVWDGYGQVSAPGPMHLIETGSVTLDDFEAELAARIRTRTGDTLEAEGLVARMFAGMRADERMLATVRAAREAGLKTGLLSNSWGNRDQYRFEHFETLFDAVVISGEVGLRKPDPAIYELAARELGVQPQECVFVDDVAPNITAAAAVGMCAIHHVDTDRTLDEISVLLGLDVRTAGETTA